MLYTNSDCAYKLLGVYHIHRPPRNTPNLPRDFVGIGYRIKGNSTFHFDGGSLYAGDGSTLFLPANTSFHNRHNEPEELVIVHLQPFGNAPKEFQLYEDTAALEPLFRKLHSLWEEGSYNRCMAILYELFSALEAPSGEVPSVIAPGVALLHRDFKNPTLTIAQAAKVCFVSEVYFRRVYRQHFGTSPLQDILSLRFEYATQLLRSGYYSVEQVARQSGFSDVKYFRTAFTKHFGTTPTRYIQRRRHYENTDHK